MELKTVWILVATTVFAAALVPIVIVLAGSKDPKFPELVVLKTATMPYNESYYTDALYTGNNFIYIIGGVRSNNDSNFILRFDIHNETIEDIGRLPWKDDGGQAIYNPKGREIYYFEGRWRSYKSLSTDPRYPRVAKLTIDDYGALKTEEILIANGSYGLLSSGVWDPHRRVAYFAGRNYTRDSTNGLWQFNPYAEDVNQRYTEILTDFPSHLVTGTMIYDDDQVFIFGAQDYLNQALTKRLSPKGRIATFDPSKRELNFTDYVIPDDVSIYSPLRWDEATGIAYSLEQGRLLQFNPKNGTLSYTEIPTSYFLEFSTAPAFVSHLKRFYGFLGSDIFYFQL